MNDRFDFYKEQYYFELSRRTEITNSLAIPIGFLSALFTGYAYFFINLNCLNNDILVLTFIILIFTSVFFSIRAIYNLFICMHGLDYGYVPAPDKLYKYEQDFIEYLKLNNLKIEELDDKFFDGLKKSIVATATNNRKNNNFRANRILKANINTIYAIIFLFFSAIPFIISKNIYDDKINNKQLKQSTMFLDDKNKKQDGDQSTGTPLPNEPAFPVDEFITESENFDIPNQSEDLSDYIEKG